MDLSLVNAGCDIFTAGGAGMAKKAAVRGPSTEIGTIRRGLSDVGPAWLSAIGTVIAAIVAVLSLWFANRSEPGPVVPSATPTTSPTAADPLAPAEVPPAVAICSAKLMFAVNGTAGPLTCMNGALNVLAWEHYSQEFDPFVMRMGSDATPITVGRAMCSDLDRAGTTISEEEDVYRVAAIYYGWEFAIDPTDFFPENC